MAKFYGKIGFGSTEETSPGVWEEVITEYSYYGDFTRNIRRYENSGNVNDDLTISNEISIVADPYARENFHKIRYIEYMDTKWKVTSVEVSYPRLILTIGGVHNAVDDGSEIETP